MCMQPISNVRRQVPLHHFKRALLIELSLQPHPHVVRLFGWTLDVDTASLMLAMEFCAG